jgi:hypothetical protein
MLLSKADHHGEQEEDGEGRSSDLSAEKLGALHDALVGLARTE